MAVVDISTRTITLKLVYYGCAQGGKTTNLVMLQKLTDPSNRQGLVSIATKDDRTLFFDLLPINLGQIGGLTVKCKLYSVPGQVHYEVTRRQILAGADGVVMVVDTATPDSKINAWAFENMRYNLRACGLDPEEVPVVVQWNKRDAPDARPLSELEATLNSESRPSQESVAISGAGVVDTFALLLKRTIIQVYSKTGRTQVSGAAIEQTIDRALDQARNSQPNLELAAEQQFDQRFDMEAYRDEQFEQGHAREIVDQETLLAESVKANMMLAERLDGFGEARDTGDRRGSMMKALGRLAPRLSDPSESAIPPGTLQLLLEAGERAQGSLLLFQSGQEVMVEREIHPGGDDLLNGIVSPGLGSIAYRLSREDKVRLIEDLGVEIFFGAVPRQAEELVSVLVAPLRCDSLRFGSLVVYGRVAELKFDAAEIEFWSISSILIGLSLHWRALRGKVTKLPTVQ